MKNMNKSYHRLYPTSREFVKKIKHNNYLYTLRSIYDTDNSKYDFDAAVRYNKHTDKYDFDKAVKDTIDLDKSYSIFNIDNIIF